MKKMLKKMSAEDRQKVLDYIANVQKAKTTMPKRNVKDVNANMDAAAIARAKAKAKNKTKAKAKNKPVDPATLTKVEVLDRAFDFGTIPQGEKVSTVYRIKNVGKNPLKISKAKGSCGCTVPQWPKEAIAPGEIAEIKVVFNSRGKRGKQQKRITITANTDPAQTFLTIKGTVEVPEKPVDKKQ
ncbi:MAG TPA: DUF1573 domain-containing protein [Phaeodactylibacter sp.]|nr:DUF1573 domain-containing protein [Phaeodactylibacter sp.]